MAALVLDASVVIGFFRAADVHHNRVRAALASAGERGDRFVLPASVLAESMVGRYRFDPGSAEPARSKIVDLFGPVRVVDEEVALTAARLWATHRALRLPDALVIATGVVEEATVLTCDQRWAAVDGRVRVVGAS